MILLFLWLTNFCFLSHSWTRTIQTCRRHHQHTLHLSSRIAKPFGRQDYWQGFYKDRQEDFTWYAGWNDLEPFVREWMDESHHILLPGVGMDSLLMDMYNAGFQNLSAFDYASESTEYCQSILGDGREIDLQTADARDLSSLYESATFDAVLDKGTLDAIYLAGDTPSERLESLEQAIHELQRVLKPGGIFLSLSAICVDALQSSNAWTGWEVLADGSLYTTNEGYTSNNVDGTLLVWKKNSAM